MIILLVTCTKVEYHLVFCCIALEGSSKLIHRRNQEQYKSVIKPLHYLMQVI